MSNRFELDLLEMDRAQEIRNRLKNKNDFLTTFLPFINRPSHSNHDLDLSFLGLNDEFLHDHMHDLLAVFFMER